MMKNSLLFDKYNELLSCYGKQNWWPAESSYEMIAGSILVQNTNWKNVEQVISSLKPFLNPTAILNMDITELEKLIRPTGFWRQKAKYLKNVFSFFDQYSIEELIAFETFELRKMLLTIQGIGYETADSILLYALDKEIFIIDTYTKRFLNRLGISHLKKYEEYRTYIESRIPRDLYIYQEFHALIVENEKKQLR